MREKREETVRLIYSLSGSRGHRGVSGAVAVGRSALGAGQPPMNRAIESSRATQPTM